MAEGGGLDQFLADLGTTDAKKKLTTGQVQAATFHNLLSKYLNMSQHLPSSEHHQLPWRPSCEYRVRIYGQLCRPACAMDAIIKLQGPRSSPSLFVSSILHSPLVFPFNIVTFDASGIPEWVRHHRVPDRPIGVRFQALSQHRPNQHSRQVLAHIIKSRRLSV